MADDLHVTCGCPHGQPCLLASQAAPPSFGDLTLEQLTDLVNVASGWGEHARLMFRRSVDQSVVPHKSCVTVSVEICGEQMAVSASGVDHRGALIALLRNIEMHHHEVLRWHKQRCAAVRKILDAHGIYYVRSDL